MPGKTKIISILLTAVVAFGWLCLPRAMAVSPRGPSLDAPAATSSPAVMPKPDAAPAEKPVASPPPVQAPVPESNKTITVDLATQTLQYFDGTNLVGEFKISSGVRNSTPTGTFSVVKKLPTVHYKGTNYDYPNTKWNLLFRPAKAGYNLYIHGAYWHNNFGHPMSHGCVNVSYANMEGLYKWADVGTKVIIQ